MKFKGVLKSIRKGGDAEGGAPNAVVCILGVGYVGESLLAQFGTVITTIGYDISEERTKTLQQKYQNNPRIKLTSDVSDLSSATHFLIAVPTLLREDHSVDLDCVKSAISSIVSYAQPGGCIVIESSVPVGTTRKLLTPYKSIFHCGMSPERIDPGRIQPTAEQIPKVISALTPRAMKHIFAIYAMVYQTLVPVSKPEVAEMTKLYENCYRMVNIAYVNEISDACISHSIDPQEMIGAAATKPFGFQPFYPGLGVGGHCIPVNPHYLFTNNSRLRVLETATKLMQIRPKTQARRYHRALQGRLFDKQNGCPEKNNIRILIVGLGFKNGQTNLACSPALSFAEAIADLGCARLAFFDPSISSSQVPWMEKLDDFFWRAEYIEAKFDGVVICNRATAIDATVLDKLSPKIFVKSYA